MDYRGGVLLLPFSFVQSGKVQPKFIKGLALGSQAIGTPPPHSPYRALFSSLLPSRASQAVPCVNQATAGVAGV